jgi:hypothetical protein
MAKPPPPPARPKEGARAKGPAPTQNDVVHNLKQPQSGALKPLNFKVDPEFHREFKLFATAHGISMLELLREGFDLVKQHRGAP